MLVFSGRVEVNGLTSKGIKEEVFFLHEYDIEIPELISIWKAGDAFVDFFDKHDSEIPPYHSSIKS